LGFDGPLLTELTMVKTYLAKKGDFTAAWHSVDADGQVLGRLAVQVARLLMGKHKPIYTPNVDCGDFVVLTNASKVRVTGNKSQTKTYEHYSYHPGGRKVTSFKTMIQRHPDRVIRHAVRLMMPKNKLAKQMLSKLKIYDGAEHPHTAQNPKPFELG
jgi:large subunit ribosomal protein L13